MKSKILALIAIVCIITGVMGSVFFGYVSFTNVMMDAKAKRFDNTQEFEYFTTREDVDTLNLYGNYDRLEIEVKKVGGNTLRVYGRKEMSYEQSVEPLYDAKTGVLDLTFKRDYEHIDPLDMFGEEDATETIYHALLNEMVNGNGYMIGKIIIEVPESLDLHVKTKSDVRLTINEGSCIKDRLIVSTDYGKVVLPRDLELEEFEYTTKSHVYYEFANLSKIKKVVLNCTGVDINTYGTIDDYKELLVDLPDEINITGEVVNITSYGPIAKRLYVNTSHYAEYVSDFEPYMYTGEVSLYNGRVFGEDEKQPTHDETFIPLVDHAYKGIISDGEQGEYTMEVYSEYQGAIMQKDQQSLIHELITR